MAALVFTGLASMNQAGDLTIQSFDGTGQTTPPATGRDATGLCAQSILKLLLDPVSQALRGQNLDVRHPGQNPSHEFLAPRRLQTHLDLILDCVSGHDVPVPVVGRNHRIFTRIFLKREVADTDYYRPS
jgi:hypothetical protein